jgi:hypothetical protein
MIKLANKDLIIGRVEQEKYCSTIGITNYEKLPINFLELLSKLAFVINTTSYHPDLICVISNDNLDELVHELSRIASFCKIVQMELK